MTEHSVVLISYQCDYPEVLDLGMYSSTILKNDLCLVLQIFLYLSALECNTTYDWLNRINQKCYIQSYKILEKCRRMFLRMVGEYGPCLYEN